jgi:hypothetical protein
LDSQVLIILVNGLSSTGRSESETFSIIVYARVKNISVFYVFVSRRLI